MTHHINLDTITLAKGELVDIEIRGALVVDTASAEDGEPS